MNDQITIVGNLAHEPELTKLSSGTPALRLRVATNRRRYDRDKDEWLDEAPNWYTVVLYRTLATHAAASLAKGQRVIVCGRLRLRAWESDKGSKGTDVEVLADAIGGDLLFGVTRFSRQGGSSATPPTAPSVALEEWARQPALDAEAVPF